jgi:hypothetical protein
MRLHDGSATAPGTEEPSRETKKSEDNDSLSLRIRLPDGKVSIVHTVWQRFYIYTHPEMNYVRARGKEILGSVVYDLCSIV